MPVPPDPHELLAELLPSPFVSSFVGRAREGDLRDSSPSRRAAAWAHWAVSSLRSFTGMSERVYPGLLLPGRFHDPYRTGPEVPPHLELSPRRLSLPDPEFPDRLSHAGSGLLFPWWVYQEVTAVRRVLLSAPSGSVAELVDELDRHRSSLVSSVSAASEALAPRWPRVERALVADPDQLLPLVVSGFSADEVSEVVPALSPLSVSVGFEPRLAESAGSWAVRRVGVWSLSASGSDGSMALGVVTPRLTANSLFRDPSFAPEGEGGAALLVRLLLLRRLAASVTGLVLPGEVSPDPSSDPVPGPFLRAQVARPGAKLPEASVASAVLFLQTFPDAPSAWRALQSWASEGYLLTVSEEGFAAAHRNALRFVRRAEEPPREDVNVVLPLAWDTSGRVVRATFVRPSV